MSADIVDVFITLCDVITRQRDREICGVWGKVNSACIPRCSVSNYFKYPDAVSNIPVSFQTSEFQEGTCSIKKGDVVLLTLLRFCFRFCVVTGGYNELQTEFDQVHYGVGMYCMQSSCHSVLSNTKCHDKSCDSLQSQLYISELQNRSLRHILFWLVSSWLFM